MRLKRRFKVYMTHSWHYNGLGVDSEYTEFLGETWAMSKAQAINNIQFRYGIKARAFFTEGAGDSYKFSVLKAIEVK